MDYDTVCLSGGGIKGIIFLGILKYLQNQKLINLSLIKNWVGTSMGAIVCYLFTIGYTIDELIKFNLEFDYFKLEPNIDVNNLFSNLGIDNGEKANHVITSFLKIKLGLSNITFSEHYKLTKKKLVIIGTNYSKGVEAVFDYINTPDLSIITALRISFSLPIIFNPILYNNDYYIDGALTNNFPINKCNIKSTLGIFIKNSCSNQMTNLLSLIYGCLSIYSDMVSLKDCPNNILNVIKIENTKNQELINFNLSYEQKLELINYGQQICEEHFKDINVKICQSILYDIINEL
jgi:predicted patatin/cPLA2 family phospholipase